MKRFSRQGNGPESFGPGPGGGGRGGVGVAEGGGEGEGGEPLQGPGARPLRERSLALTGDPARRVSQIRLGAPHYSLMLAEQLSGIAYTGE